MKVVTADPARILSAAEFAELLENSCEDDPNCTSLLHTPQGAYAALTDALAAANAAFVAQFGRTAEAQVELETSDVRPPLVELLFDEESECGLGHDWIDDELTETAVFLQRLYFRTRDPELLDFIRSKSWLVEGLVL